MPVEEGIREFLALGKSAEGRKHVAMPWIEAVGADVAAYMTLRTVFDHLALGRANAKHVALDIARLVLDELRYRKFKAEAPALFKYRMDSFSTNHYSHRKKSLDATMAYAAVDTSEFELLDRERILLGVKLLDILVTCTGIATVDAEDETYQQGRGRLARRKTTWLTPTADTVTWLSKRNAHLESIAPVTMPMVLPPVPWAPGQRGGYRFGLRGKYPMTRRGGLGKNLAVDAANMPVVHEALNRIQETGWQINRSVLALLRQMTERQMLPGLAEQELPRKPQDIDTDKEARRVWRRAASAVKEANRQALANRLQVSRLLRLAESLAEDVFYFPSNCDFRGRVYPIPVFLTPQGDDMQKALLTFDTAVPLGEWGYKWLTLHGANCLDETPEGQKMSTMTLDERRTWMEAHARQIESVADDPLSSRWWLEADQPLQFYAFAVEWTSARRSGDRASYCSSLPVAQDGSCNGIQHFSALLRDPIGGAAVNLRSHPYPSDLYATIAGVARDILQHDAAHPPVEEGPDACRWPLLWLTCLVEVNRKLAKRPTMTFGYGSRVYGFSQQIVDYLKTHEKWEQVKQHFTFTDVDGKERSGLSRACDYLAEVFWRALRSRVVAAFNGMEWLRECAGILASHGNSLRWTVPGTGFPVVQEYFEQRDNRVKTMLAGQAYRPVIYSDSKNIRVEKHKNAISPNFIHSLDAAVLMRTVVLGAASGLTHFSMVHDSFGTHAGRSAELAYITRKAFVEYYLTYNPFQELREEFVHAAEGITGEGWEGGAEIPAYPAPGDLDIREVLHSPYFFA